MNSLLLRAYLRVAQKPGFAGVTGFLNSLGNPTYTQYFSVNNLSLRGGGNQNRYLRDYSLAPPEAISPTRREIASGGGIASCLATLRDSMKAEVTRYVPPLAMTTYALNREVLNIHELIIPFF